MAVTKNLKARLLESLPANKKIAVLRLSRIILRAEPIKEEVGMCEILTNVVDHFDLTNVHYCGDEILDVFSIPFKEGHNSRSYWYDFNRSGRILRLLAINSGINELTKIKNHEEIKKNA